MQGGELIYSRRKAVTLKCFYFNQYRPKSSLCARDKCRRIDTVVTTRDGLRFDLGAACLQKTKHLFLQALLASADHFRRWLPMEPQTAPCAVRSHGSASGSPGLW